MDEPKNLSSCRFCSILILTALGLLFALILLELFVRLLVHPSLRANPALKERPKFFYRPADSADMAGNTFENPKHDGTFRISVVGDSFTFAPGVQFDDTFSEHLERMLNLNQAQRKVEVINLGRPGLSTFQEIQNVRKALEISSDLILIEITLNDAQLRQLHQEPPEVREQFGAYVPSGRLSFLINRWKTLRFILERIHNWSSVGAYIKYHHDLYNNPKAWNLFSESVRKMVNMTQERKVALGFVLFPLFDFELNAHYPFADIHSKIAAEISQYNLPLLDLFDRYQGIPVGRLQLRPGSDTHPNEIAHRIAAEAIYQWGAAKGIFPQDALIKHSYKLRNSVQEASGAD